jgi:hypothetical protein
MKNTIVVIVIHAINSSHIEMASHYVLVVQQKNISVVASWDTTKNMLLQATA